jgi:hypothetical protein
LSNCCDEHSVPNCKFVHHLSGPQLRPKPERRPRHPAGGRMPPPDQNRYG